MFPYFCYIKVGEKLAKKSKYNVDLSEKGKNKRTYNGILFDSETEMKFLIEWIEPKLKIGEIVSYERQVPYILQEGFVNFEGKKILPIKYVADYVITFSNGKRIVVDVKGLPDSLAKTKRKLYEYKYRDVAFYWYCRSVKYSRNGEVWMTYEELESRRKADKKSKMNK